MEYYEVAEITLNLNSKGYEMGDEESSYMGPDYKKAIIRKTILKKAKKK